MLFIGKCLNFVRGKSSAEYGLQALGNLSSALRELSALRYPLEPASLSRAIIAIRVSLSRTTLQNLLPLPRVVDILRLLRDFFLLANGDFAMALTEHADAKLGGWWKRGDSQAYEKRESLGIPTLDEGDIMAVLARTWASLGSLQGQHADGDYHCLELARNLLHLQLIRPKPDSHLGLDPNLSPRVTAELSTTPFRNLLFSFPVVLTADIPSPLNMFLGPSDLQTYSTANSYLLSIRRAYLHLTDLWKITSLRRQHLAPLVPVCDSHSGRAQTRLLRCRFAARSKIMRRTWVTANAALFFLAETESYLQAEVVTTLWNEFHDWIIAHERIRQRWHSQAIVANIAAAHGKHDRKTSDIWRSQSTSALRIAASEAEYSANPTATRRHHDFQNLATAHARYIASVSHHLLLTSTAWTDSLFALLLDIDHLVSHVRRLHEIWTSIDVESDVRAAVPVKDLDKEEADVKAALREAERRVKVGIEQTIGALRTIESNARLSNNLDVPHDSEDAGLAGLCEEVGIWDPPGQYIPRRVGGLERLLTKLEFKRCPETLG